MDTKAKVTAFNYAEESLERDLKCAFEKLNWKNYIKKDTKVFVKPNFTVPFPKPGVATNVNVIETTLNLLKSRAMEVYIGESDGGDQSFTAEYSLKNHGIPAICKRTGAEMINLSNIEWIKVCEKINGKKIDVTLPRFLLKMDESISIPVLKVHVMTTVSLSLKNLWGCHPSSLRLLDHKYLSERLILIAKSIHLRYVIIDAIYGLNNYGPMDGEVVKVGGIIVGDNPVATDAVSARLMGFEPEKILHINKASVAGLGPYKSEEIEVLSDISQFQQHFIVKPTIIDLASSLCFKSNILNKIVSDSVFSKPIYNLLGKEPRKKIIKPGDEI
jgi:uncharacterized protein (DUF362 family)